MKILKNLLGNKKTITKRTCPICNFQGGFQETGNPPRTDATCPICGSFERHRLFWLWYLKNPRALLPPIIHFAAEVFFAEFFKERLDSSNYMTANISGNPDIFLNIESINLPNSSVSTVICNHVLEHVNDRKALSEIHRVLSKNGILIVSVPIIEGWEKTYEDSSIQSPEERELHFGQSDHIRYYGRDFRDRLNEAGFIFDEITAEGPDVISYSLLRGEKFFVCRKH